MKTVIQTLGSAIALSAALLVFGAASGQAASDHAHDQKNAIHDGYFEDSQIKPRQLSDWEGDWQSVYPYLVDGTLDPMLEHKAEHGDKTVAEYRSYYEEGYKTDVDRITINGQKVTFHRGQQVISGDYASDGLEVLTYKKGNRGVRFIFKKISGDEAAPNFIQFSDHLIAPEKAGHYHLYWGNDRSALLKQLSNWPTYYPDDLNGKQILEEMLAH